MAPPKKAQKEAAASSSSAEPVEEPQLSPEDVERGQQVLAAMLHKEQNEKYIELAKRLGRKTNEIEGYIRLALNHQTMEEYQKAMIAYNFAISQAHEQVQAASDILQKKEYAALQANAATQLADLLRDIRSYAEAYKVAEEGLKAAHLAERYEFCHQLTEISASCLINTKKLDEAEAKIKTMKDIAALAQGDLKERLNSISTVQLAVFYLGPKSDPASAEPLLWDRLHWLHQEFEKAATTRNLADYRAKFFVYSGRQLVTDVSEEEREYVKDDETLVQTAVGMYMKMSRQDKKRIAAAQAGGDLEEEEVPEIVRIGKEDGEPMLTAEISHLVRGAFEVVRLLGSCYDKKKDEQMRQIMWMRLLSFGLDAQDSRTLAMALQMLPESILKTIQSLEESDRMSEKAQGLSIQEEPEQQ